MSNLVLVPIDGSERAFKALDIAGDLAEKHGSSLALLHVIPESKIPEGLDRWVEIENVKTPPSALYEDAVANRLLKDGERRLNGKKISGLECILERGDPAKRILEVAKRRDVSLIVMATRGLSDIQGLILGSVAHKISHAAPCTVVTVR